MASGKVAVNEWYSGTDAYHGLADLICRFCRDADSEPRRQSIPKPSASLTAFVTPRVTHIAAGLYHSLAVMEGGALYSTGRSDDMQLGRDGTSGRWRRVCGNQCDGSASVVG